MTRTLVRLVAGPVAFRLRPRRSRVSIEPPALMSTALAAGCGSSVVPSPIRNSATSTLAGVAGPGGTLARCRAVVCCFALGAALAACASSGGGPSPSTPWAGSSSAASQTPTADREAADQAGVQAAYQRFWSISGTFDQQYPESDWRVVMGQVAVDPELSLVVAYAGQQRRAGIKVYGYVLARLSVPPVHGAARVTVHDCQDASKSGVADARSGRPRTVGIPRNPVIAVLVRGGDGGWRVSSVKYPGGSC